jgi:hypothetical protein
MIEQGRASEDEVVLAFLRAEINSTMRQQHYMRCVQSLGLDRASLLDTADLTDEHANYARKVILGAVRGFGRGLWLFEGFPTNTAWRRVLVEPADFHRLKCISMDTQWRDLTRGTRLIQEAACNFDADPEVGPIVRGIMQAIESGSPLNELIMVETSDALVLLEGNKRATAYAALANRPFEAFLGTSPSMGGWAFGRE